MNRISEIDVKGKMGNLLVDLREWILVAVVFVFAWAAFSVKRLIFKKIKMQRKEGKRTLDPFTSHVFEKILSIVILFFSATILLQIFGMDILPLITVSGIGAAIFGFASKDVIANFFGGVMIYVTRPFIVEDQIEIPGKSVLGFVEEIGWYHTLVRDMQKKILYVPNAIFLAEVLLNYSRMSHRRLEETVRIRVRGSRKAQEMLGEVRKIIFSHPEIDHREQASAYVSSVSPWGIVFEVKAYTQKTKYLDYMRIKEEILLDIYTIAYEKEGIRPPTCELEIAQEKPSSP